MTHPTVHARTHPNKIAYQMAGTGKAITYRELDELSNQGAHLFRSLGLKAGDHIALLMENRLAFMEICWAAQRSRAVLHRDQPLPDAGRDRLHRQGLRHKVFITTPKCFEQVKGLVGQKGGPILYMMDEPESGFTAPGTRKRARSRRRRLRTKSPAMTCCIHPATGRPKGIKKDFEGNKIGDYPTSS